MKSRIIRGKGEIYRQVTIRLKAQHLHSLFKNNVDRNALIRKLGQVMLALGSYLGHRHRPRTKTARP